MKKKRITNIIPHNDLTFLKFADMNLIVFFVLFEEEFESMIS